MVQGYLYQLLGTIIHEHLYDEDKYENVSSERLASMKNVLLYISENYNNNISLETLSKIAGMNPKYFCRYFRTVIHRTPMDYLNFYRVERACQMLGGSELSVSEIGYRCGFNDSSYFVKIFKKYMGTTPKQYALKQ